MQIGRGLQTLFAVTFRCSGALCEKKTFRETKKKQNIKTHEMYKFIDFLINILW